MSEQDCVPKRTRDDVKRTHPCGCKTRRCYDLDKEEWVWLYHLCDDHQIRAPKGSSNFMWLVKQLMEEHRILAESAEVDCYCECHRVHSEGYPACEQCNCWWTGEMQGVLP